ncbi:hypothetical protein [Thermosipho melanesiensis]|uniref:Uncharacterized protein n=1 Tax=Thermosipho melanesiensis (strain DSM 12029 / CIP 104789 / BI429) TaxID=391009 RepID=A6LJE6_THEM4|nr:hypothetical protein [Thermosipho melanesiensis]ABR30047.1 hypothetical protein Tmel_0170 [Thermosipho melanesiensis BI429]
MGRTLTVIDNVFVIDWPILTLKFAFTYLDPALNPAEAVTDNVSLVVLLTVIIS